MTQVLGALFTKVRGNAEARAEALAAGAVEAVVAALRETSILFAVLMGWLIFGEKMTGEKALAAAVIVAGVILTRI